MNLNFYKYQALGNDFILVDDMKTNISPKLNETLITKLCNRKFGIGADGILVLVNHPKYDFEIKYFNSDGSPSLCCNGSRCAIDYAYSLGIINKNAEIMAYDGTHKAFIEDSKVKIQMKNINKIEYYGEDMFINTGAPHYIRFWDNLAIKDISKLGKSIKKDFEKDTNITFIENTKPKTLNGSVFATTYEKGVEEETLACGTGAIAAAIASNIKYKIPSPICINMKGGKLYVEFNKDKDTFKDIFIKGDANEVFKGNINIKNI